jgi:hypothetical protein
MVRVCADPEMVIPRAYCHSGQPACRVCGFCFPRTVLRPYKGGWPAIRVWRHLDVSIATHSYSGETTVQRRPGVLDRGPYVPTPWGITTRRPEPSHGPRAWLEGWWRLTAPADVPPIAGFAERDRLRRGRLASTLMLCAIVIGLVGLYTGLTDPNPQDGPLPGMFYLLPYGLIAGIVVLVLNRAGRVNLAGILMVAIADLPIMTVVVYAPGRQLDLAQVPAFYILAVAVLFAATTLPPEGVFPVAVGNALLIFLVIWLMPHSAALRESADSPDDTFSLFAIPIALQFIVAVVAYLWARSMLDTIRRADVAEAVAELERREATRKRALEEGVGQIQAVLVQLANGDFSARVPALQDALLWQVGNTLNVFIGRLGRYAQADFALQRTQDEARRLAEALLLWRNGRQPTWPEPSGTPLDLVVTAFRDLRRSAGAPQ